MFRQSLESNERPVPDDHPSLGLVLSLEVAQEAGDAFLGRGHRPPELGLALRVDVFRRNVFERELAERFGQFQVT